MKHIIFGAVSVFLSGLLFAVVFGEFFHPLVYIAAWIIVSISDKVFFPVKGY